jgi:cytochrome c-type biogenesis protein CcmH/NrfF
MLTTKIDAQGPLPRGRFRATRWLQLLAVALLSVFVMGAGDDMEARFNSIGHKKLICACGCNQILLECNHLGCTYSDRMRNELTAALSRGESDDLALQTFVQKYGPTVLAAPTTSGFNLVAWIMPYLVLAAGFAFAGIIVMSWKNKPLSQLETPESTEQLEEFREKARRETEL